MEIKFLHVMDSMTHIPVMAIMFNDLTRLPDLSREVLAEVGFRTSPFLFVTKLNNQETHCDPYDWNDGTRTMGLAHHYINISWDVLKNGDSIDVEFLKGEKLVARNHKQYHSGEGEVKYV